MSARRQTAGRSRVRECATVTVQLSPSSSCAIGRPTMFDRPITTASSPASSPSRSRSSIRQPSGVQGTIARRPVASRPALATWKPSTSFSGATASSTRSGVDVRRQRQLHQDAVDRRVAVQPLDQRQELGLGVAASSRCSSECIPASTVARPLLRT